MKDITRIHIAKVTYSIEPDAKKVLEKYLASLEAYSDDSELLNDIEIRITELLGERHVKPEGVIAESDVDAIRQQLGEPKDFMGDEISIDDTMPVSKERVRKLYRNLDDYLIGGVSSGIASYFGIKALWIRLIFIAITILSCGLAALVYILLWAITPPAKTAADKLQMQGRAVTLASIRELNESPADEYIKIRAARIRRLISIVLGIAFVGLILVIIAVYVTVWLHYTYTIDGQTQTYFPVTSELSVSNSVYLGAYILSGTSLVVLCIMGAYAAFARKITKRIIVSAIIITAATGLIVGGAYGFELYSEWQTNQQTLSNTKEMQVKVPEGFNTVNSLVANVPFYIDVTYIVDSSQRSITFKSTRGLTLSTSVTGKTANITFDPTNQPATVPMSSITIYGPELDSISAKGTHLTYQSANQDQLQVDAGQGSSIFINTSTIATVSAKLDGSSNLNGGSSSIETANITTLGGSYVRLGTIKSLNITNPDVCAVDTQTNIEVHSIRDSTYTHNGISMASNQSLSDICIVVTIDPLEQ